MKGNTAMITEVLQSLLAFRHPMWYTCGRFTKINFEVYFLCEV